MRIVLAICFMATVMSGSAKAQQEFSCRIGYQPACLNFTDKVCGSFSKCVAEDAACFDSHQCDSRGFICKSSAEDMRYKMQKQLDLASEDLRTAQMAIDSKQTELSTAAIKLASCTSGLDQATALAASFKQDIQADQIAEKDLADRMYAVVQCLDKATTLESAKACKGEANPR